MQGLVAIAAALALAGVTTISLQPVFAGKSSASGGFHSVFATGDTGGVKGTHSAVNFAPGHLAVGSGTHASHFAPGLEAKIGKCDSWRISKPCEPGIEKQIQTGPGG